MKSREERKNLILELMKEPAYQPLRAKEIAVFMQVEQADRPELAACLEELVEEGKIRINKRGRYSVEVDKVLQGEFTAHANGFGFVRIEGRAEDLYIPKDQTMGAFHRDVVEVQLLPGRTGQRTSAKVVKVVDHNIKEVIGIFQRNRSYGFVIPDNQRIVSDIFIPTDGINGAENGDKVCVELTHYGNYGDKGHRSPEGKVKEILGYMDDPGVDMLSVLRSYEIPMDFPEAVLHQAQEVSISTEEEHAAECARRLDLRDTLTITIDGEDARDLDDAVSLTVENGNYHLGVHIADVTFYVRENSPLDREALNRGTSVYLPDRVVPMLPRQLSNGICSLNEKEDRFTLSCLMTFDANGNLLDSTVAESVIRSDHRMTYTACARMLEEQDAALLAEYADIAPMLEQMGQLSKILREKRHKRGAVDFDFPESKLIIAESGETEAIVPAQRNTATKLIEDFMLAANETIAEHFYWMQVPFVYRVHDEPDPDKIRQLLMFAGGLGYSVKTSKGEVHPRELQQLLERVEGKPEQPMIERMTLRSMRRAIYSPECRGHFGLAGRYYCHFTSPIRRYPDLQIHRIIREQLQGTLTEDRLRHYEQILEDVAAQSSTTERRAEEAEREAVRIKKANFMEKHIGETFRGVINGVTAWGLYVELENTCEGMVHISVIPGDYYYYSEYASELVGEVTGRRFRLGQELNVKVRFVDAVAHTIDFDIVE